MLRLLARSAVVATVAAAFACGTRAGAAETLLPVLVAQAAGTWCLTIPLERSFCRALTLDGPRRRLRLALAATGDARERGLMNVSAIPRDEGMLFVFPESVDRLHDFWMKDTRVSLDMVFVRHDGTVASVAARVPAMRPHAREADIAHRSAVCRYVIELGAGGAAAAGLRPGLRLVIPPLTAE